MANEYYSESNKSTSGNLGKAINYSESPKTKTESLINYDTRERINGVVLPKEYVIVDSPNKSLETLKESATNIEKGDYGTKIVELKTPYQEMKNVDPTKKHLLDDFAEAIKKDDRLQFQEMENVDPTKKHLLDDFVEAIKKDDRLQFQEMENVDPTKKHLLDDFAEAIKTDDRLQFQEMENVDPTKKHLLDDFAESLEDVENIKGSISTERINGVKIDQISDTDKKIMEDYIANKTDNTDDRKVLYDNVTAYYEERPVFTETSYDSAEEMKGIRDFVDGVDSLIKDIDAFNNDSYNVRGSFGQAMAYSSDVCKGKMELLKQFVEQNMASAMSDVGEYDSNYEQIKGIVVPIAGSIDKVKFMDNGSISIPNLSGTAFAQSHISQAETLNKRNMAIKDRLEALTNERIDRVG